MRVGLAAIPAAIFAGGLPAWRCSLQSLPHDLDAFEPTHAKRAPVQSFQTAPKHEEPVTRETMRPRTPAAPIKPFFTFPDHVVVRALGAGEQAFLRCFHRAQRVDPLLSSAKVQLHLELDASGVIVDASTS